MENQYVLRAMCVVCRTYCQRRKLKSNTYLVVSSCAFKWMKQINKIVSKINRLPAADTLFGLSFSSFISLAHENHSSLDWMIVVHRTSIFIRKANEFIESYSWMNLYGTAYNATIAPPPAPIPITSIRFISFWRFCDYIDDSFVQKKNR